MPYFEHDGLSFYYAQKGKGIPFIFQHGLGSSAEQIQKIYSPAPEVQLITFDFRGHGKTPLGREDSLSFNTFADDITALMNHLQLSAAVIGGISMGAAVALNFALRYPAKTLGLILSRPAWLDGPMQQQNRVLFRFIATLIREHGREKGRQRFINSDVYIQLSNVSPSTAQSLLGQFNYEKALETAAKFERLPEDVPSNDRSDWKRLTMPTLVLANQSDLIHPFEYGQVYKNCITDADFKELIPKSINEEQHNKDVQQAIDAFINHILETHQAT